MAEEETVSKTDLQAERTRNLPAGLSELPPTAVMAGFQLQLSAPGRYMQNEDIKRRLAEGALSLYLELEPADAIDKLLAMLAVGVGSASLDCLTQAASMSSEYLDRRDLNLRHGFKGAAVAAELLKVLDARRGDSVSRKVTVGSVNVEAGAQAIIGNVEAPRRKDRLEPRGAEVLAQADEPELEGDNA
jgi:hypothetical protein